MPRQPADSPTTTPSFELPSSSGRESICWTIQATDPTPESSTLPCAIEVHGRFYSPREQGVALDDYTVTATGLHLHVSTLQALAARLSAWLELPIRELAATPLEVDVPLGGSFDQSVHLTVGRSASTIETVGKHTATLTLHLGSMSGALSFPVDQSCIRILRDGILRVL